MSSFATASQRFAVCRPVADRIAAPRRAVAARALAF